MKLQTCRHCYRYDDVDPCSRCALMGDRELALTRDIARLEIRIGELTERLRLTRLWLRALYADAA